jgi:hypothetical protein
MRQTTETGPQVKVGEHKLRVTHLEVMIYREAVARSIKKLRPRYAKMLKRLAE